MSQVPSVLRRRVLPRRKEYRLFIQRIKKQTPKNQSGAKCFAVFEADKSYPKGFVCNLPKNIKTYNEWHKPIASKLFRASLSEFAEGLLVDANYRYEKDIEIQAEILQRLCLIWAFSPAVIS